VSKRTTIIVALASTLAFVVAASSAFADSTNPVQPPNLSAFKNQQQANATVESDVYNNVANASINNLTKYITPCNE